MTATVTLAPRLDLTTVQPLVSEITGCAGTDLVVDAGHVEHLGALAAQVLLAADRQWQANGHRLVVGPRSPSFEDALAAMGLAGHFTAETCE